LFSKFLSSEIYYRYLVILIIHVPVVIVKSFLQVPV